MRCDATPANVEEEGGMKALGTRVYLWLMHIGKGGGGGAADCFDSLEAFTTVVNKRSS